MYAQRVVTSHRRGRGKANGGNGVTGMAGEAWPLPAGVIGTTFITNKGAFGSLCHVLPLSLTLLPDGTGAYPSYVPLAIGLANHFVFMLPV